MPTKWTLPTGASIEPQVRVDSFDVDESTDKPGPKREIVLRRSLELARGQSGNGRAIYNIVDKSLDAWLVELAMEALASLSTGSEDDDWWFCFAVCSVFQKPRHWRRLTTDFADFASSRVLNASEQPSNVIVDGHTPDQRSEALGYLGMYFLALGDQDRAISLLEAADDARDVDESIKTIALGALEADSDAVEGALALVDLINNKKLKAEALSEISDYL